MENRDRRFCYFRITLYNLITSNIILIIFVVIDYLSVYSNIILTISILIQRDYDETTNPIFYLSPFNIFKHYLGDINEIYFSLLVISFIAIICYIGFIYSLDEIKMEPTKAAQITFNRIFVNFYELFIFRLFAIFFFDSMISIFILLVFNSELDDILNIISLTLLFIYFISYFFWNISNMRLNCIWSNFKFVESAFLTYPFDIVFSLKYDSFILIAKILISLSKNLISLDKPTIYSENANFFILVMLEIIISFMFIQLIYDFFIQSDNFLYYQINKTNIIRIFLTIFSGTSIIIKLMLHQNFNYIIIPVLILDLMGLILLFYYHFMDNLISRMIKSTDYIGVLVFLISNDVDKKNCICQWLIYHRLYCKNYICNICQKISLSSQQSKEIPIQNAKIEFGDFNKISFGKFFHLLIDESLFQIRNKKGITSNGIFYLECLELIDFFISGKSQRIIFYVCFYKALKKYVNLNFLYHNNLLIMFDYIKKKNAEFLKQYAQFQQSERLNHLFLDFIDDFENFLHYSIKSPDNVVKISEKYDSLIKNNQANKYFPPSIQEYNYQQIILRYIFELITKNTLPEAHEYDITTLFDYIDSHYKNDQIIYIKYSFKANSSYIIKAGGPIKPNINKPFESIFPNSLKIYGLNAFIEQVYQNNFKDENNNFEFVSKNIDEGFNLYVESFQMKYVLYPAIETDEMIVAGSFVIGYEDVLIFEKNTSKESYLNSFSKKIEYYFALSPAIIQNFKSNGKTFSFNQLFHKKCIKENVYGYLFQFHIYIALLNDYLDDTNELNDDIVEKIAHLKQLESNIKAKPLILEEKYSITVENSTYIIYFVKQDKKNDLDKEKDTTIQQTIQNQNQNYNYHNTCFDNVSMSCTSSVSSKSSRFFTKISTKKVSSIEKKGLRTINLFVRIISGFNLLLVGLCLIFLGLEINNDQQFQTLFFLFQKYKDFKLGMETQPLRIFSNICFAKFENPQSTDCVNIYHLYSKSFQSSYPDMKKYPLINEVIVNELKGGLDSIRTSFNEFQNEIYRLNLKETKQIYSYKSRMLTLISGEDSKVEVMISNNTFFEAVHLYQNYFSQIINNGVLESTSINFISMNPITFQIDPLTLDISILSQDQKNIYQVILNYPFIQKSIDDCEVIIEFGFEKYLSSIEEILIIFTVLLLFLHCILVIICLQFIKNYKKVIHEDYCKVLLIISSPLYISFINNQIRNIKILMQLYNDKPSLVMSNIDNDQENYRKDKREEIKQIRQTPSNVIQVNLQVKSNDIYDPMVAVFRKIILITFVCYICFFIVIFLVLFMVLQNLKFLVEFTNINTVLDNYIYNNLNANQFILIANITGNELSEMVNNNNSYHYIQKGIAAHYNSIEKLEVFIEKHKNYLSISDVANLNCENFNKFKDKIVLSAEKEMEIELSGFLQQLCNSTSIMAYQNENLVQKEICYTMKKISNYPIKIEHTEKINYLRNTILYDLYNIVLILNRLLRANVNEVLLPNQVLSISTQFRTAVSTCLVLNCVFEILIVVILLFFVLRKMIELNRIFMQFMKFLE